MRVLVATPLYPPEIAEAAVYAKELARRLSANHEVTVLAYAHLPEPLPGVRTLAIEKRQTRFARLLAFRRALAREAKNADIILAVNGPSIELPLLLGTPAPVILSIADTTAHAHGGLLERFAFAGARAVIQPAPSQKPEILPFEPRPDAALAAWESSWQEHLAVFETKLYAH